MKITLSFAAALLVVCTSALAQHDHGRQEPPLDRAMMEAMMRAGTPGEPHKKLDVFAGNWNATVRSWVAPGTEPVVMEGTSTTRWVMGGRYLEQRFTGTFFGMPYEGLGYTGYDNVKKQYWSTWMDNMSTSMMMSTGNVDGATWSFTGSMTDPMTGKDGPAETKVVVRDGERHTMEMWAPGPDGKMFRMMEIAYSRKK